MDRESARLRFVDALGAGAVLDEPAQLQPYASDYTEEAPRMPGLVVRPDTVEQVQAIVRIANAERWPLTVRISGSNVGGLSIPPAGGVVVDLQQMNRIHHVSADDMYALIEPGATWEQLKAHLTQENLPLRLGYPLSPPDTSIVANCLLDGLGNLSMRYGSMGDWIGGLEAVLPDGELVRTGACAMSDVWFGRGPLPDLTGLFVCWQGTTGIVTKLAFQLWPQPPHRRRMFVLMYDRNSAFRAMRELCRAPVCDDVGGLSWPTGKMLLGVQHPAERDPDEPEFFLYLDVTGESALELELRLQLLDQLLARQRAQGARMERPIDVQTLVKLNPRFERFAEFPTRLEFLVDHPGGGLTWVGTYGPMSRFEAFGDRGVDIMARYGVPPVIVSRPMKGGHFGVMRFIALFDQQDEAQRQRMRHLNHELIAAGLDLGFVPYKTPPWVVQAFGHRLQPGFARVMRTVRAALDPNGIMAPQCWALPGDDEPPGGAAQE